MSTQLPNISNKQIYIEFALIEGKYGINLHIAWSRHMYSIVGNCCNIIPIVELMACALLASYFSFYDVKNLQHVHEQQLSDDAEYKLLASK